MTELATENQKEYMDKLKIQYPKDITKEEAKVLIQEVLNNKYPADKKLYNKTSYTSNNQAKENSIVAQVLTKCYVELISVNKKLEPKELLDAYKFFISNL